MNWQLYWPGWLHCYPYYSKTWDPNALGDAGGLYYNMFGFSIYQMTWWSMS
jgi:hypothetical protein